MTIPLGRCIQENILKHSTGFEKEFKYDQVTTKVDALFSKGMLFFFFKEFQGASRKRAISFIGYLSPCVILTYMIWTRHHLSTPLRRTSIFALLISLCFLSSAFNKIRVQTQSAHNLQKAFWATVDSLKTLFVHQNNSPDPGMYKCFIGKIEETINTLTEKESSTVVNHIVDWMIACLEEAADLSGFQGDKKIELIDQTVLYYIECPIDIKELKTKMSTRFEHRDSSIPGKVTAWTTTLNQLFTKTEKSLPLRKKMITRYLDERIKNPKQTDYTAPKKFSLFLIPSIEEVIRTIGKIESKMEGAKFGEERLKGNEDTKFNKMEPHEKELNKTLKKYENMLKEINLWSEN